MNWIVLLNDSTLAEHRGFSFGKLKYYFGNKLEIKMPEDLNEALISACREGNIIEAKRLLAEGADVNAIDYAMQTPIWKAVRSRNVELVKLLIKNGARVKIGDENRETPIAYAETLGFRSSDELYKVLYRQFEIEAKPIADGLFEQGNISFNEKRFKDAINYYDEAIMYYYDYPQVFFNRGLAKKEINDINGACKDWREASKMGIEKAYKLLWEYYPTKYDFEKSPEEAKIKIADSIVRIIRKLGANASFEDVVRDFISGKGEVNAEKMFRVFEFGWEKSGHSPENYFDTYYRLFCSANKINDIKDKGEGKVANKENNLIIGTNDRMNQATNESIFSNRFTVYEKECILKLLWQLANISPESWFAAQPSLNTASALLNMSITPEIKELKISSKEACKLLKNHTEKDWIVTMIFTLATSDAQDKKEKNKLLSIYMDNLGITPEELLLIKNKENAIAAKFKNQSVRTESTRDKLLFNGLVAIIIFAIIVFVKSCF